MKKSQDEFWVFGYGSLMWRPDFPYLESAPALVYSYHRSLCVYSYVHRGTPEKPGLVLGLDCGGSCQGVAFRVADEKRSDVLSYLRARELVTHVYRECLVFAHLSDGRKVSALTYVVDHAHHQYAGVLNFSQKLNLILQGQGISGDNISYIRGTHEHLQQLGLRDETLTRLLAHIDQNKKI